MQTGLQIPKKLTAMLVYGRPPLVFGGLLCALGVMWSLNSSLYILGVILLFISMCFDIVDGWFADRYRIHSVLAHLADRVMDKVVSSIIFPLVAVGTMWRLHYIVVNPSRAELLHAIFILLLCVTVMIRDSLANFIRLFTARAVAEPESHEFTRIRLVFAAPVGAILYAHAFYIPEVDGSRLYHFIAGFGNLPLRSLFIIEIIFLVINLGSIAGYCRKYGAYFLDEICDEDERLRRKILSFFPNTLTVLNALMGLLALFFAYQWRLKEAYLVLIGATLFDKLDGAVARRLGLTEPMAGDTEPKRFSLGAIMDDVADAISFCMVPALIFYLALTGAGHTFLPLWLIKSLAWFYALMGIARLIYFTVDPRPIPGFFKGIPTPAAALLVMAPMIMYGEALQGSPAEFRFWALFSCGLMAFTGVLMNLYPIHYIHFGRFMDRHAWFSRVNLLAALIFLFTPWFGYYALCLMIIYVFSPIVTRRVQARLSATEAAPSTPSEKTS
jgi:phosphatidylserine synthase